MSLFCWTQRKRKAPLTSIVFFVPTMEVNGAPKQPGYKLSSKYLPWCSAEQRHSYRFGTTWGWVNDDRIFIFRWTIPLMSHWIIHSNKWFKTLIHSGTNYIWVSNWIIQPTDLFKVLINLVQYEWAIETLTRLICLKCFCGFIWKYFH